MIVRLSEGIHIPALERNLVTIPFVQLRHAIQNVEVLKNM
jgi:hypothetical protein